MAKVKVVWSIVHAIYNIQSNPTQGQKIMQLFMSNIEEWCAILPSKSMKYKKKGLIGTWSPAKPKGLIGIRPKLWQKLAYAPRH